MKSHLKNTSILIMGAHKAVGVLAVAALTVAVTFAASVPVHAASAAPVSLQCQESTNGSGYALACSGAIPPDGTGTLQCQSPNTIGNNNGVFTIAQANCTGTASIAGVSIPGTLNTAVLVVDTNHGTISANEGTGTLAVNEGLSSMTGSCQGASLSATSSPLALSVPDGTCNINVGVLGIGTAQIAIQSGSISATTTPPLIVSINSPKTSVNASVLGLVANIACGASVAVNLSQLVPITTSLAPCVGS